MLLFLSLKLTFTFLSVDFIPLIKVHFEIQKYGARVMKVVLITVSSPESNVKAKRQGFRTFFLSLLHSHCIPALYPRPSHPLCL